MAHVISAVFDTRTAAAAAVDRLVASGFSRDDISILVSDGTPGRQLGVQEGTKAAEGTAAGAAAGGALGAILAGLVVATGGVGVAVAGPIVAALAGLGAGGTLGGVVGAAVGASMPEHEVKLYGDLLEAGGVLVALKAHDDRSDLAETILDESGGDHVRRA